MYYENPPKFVAENLPKFVREGKHKTYFNMFTVDVFHLIPCGLLVHFNPIQTGL